MDDLSMLKICSFNASGLRIKQKLITLLQYFKSIKADIIFLQETHLIDKDKEYISKIWENEFHLYGECTNSKGILTLFSNNINRDNIKLISSSDRYIISCINSKDRNYLVVNTYAPNDNKDKLYFFNHIAWIPFS